MIQAYQKQLQGWRLTEIRLASNLYTWNMVITIDAVLFTRSFFLSFYLSIWADEKRSIL